MNRLLLVALIALVGAGLIAGFMVVGGPGYARMEKNDAKRLGDLRRLADFHICQLKKTDPELDGISPNRCLGFEQEPDLKDPVTGAPYQFTKTGDAAFRVCGTFQTDSQKSTGSRFSVLTFEGQQGCIVFGDDAQADAAGATLEWSKD